MLAQLTPHGAMVVGMVITALIFLALWLMAKVAKYIYRSGRPRRRRRVPHGYGRKIRSHRRENVHARQAYEELAEDMEDCMHEMVVEAARHQSRKKPVRLHPVD